MFDLTPILTADLPVQIHIVAALEAVVLTPIALFRKRRDRLHKLVGYAWVTNIVIAALSSFWITGIRIIGPFSPIHALSLLVLVNMTLGVNAIRNGNLRKHQTIMRQTAFWALGVAGGLTLLPGRRMNAVFFGADPMPGSNFAPFVAIAVFVAAVGYFIFLWARANGQFRVE